MTVGLTLQERAECLLIVRERQDKEGIEVPTSNASKYANDPVGFVRDCFRWKTGEGATPYQNDVMRELVEYKRVSVRGPHGLGKAHPYRLVIDTPTGKRFFGSLNVGDKVFGANGKPTTVTGTFERGEMEVYRVVFNDHSETLCSKDHLWTVRKFDWDTKYNTCWETLSLEELIAKGVTRPNGEGHSARKYAIPTVEPLEYPYQWTPVDPYTLGAWLGDGSRNSGRVSGKDREVSQRIQRAGYKVVESQQPTCLQWSVYTLSEGLRRAGVLDCKARSKFVPTIYLENIPEIRREVLRGLLDTDGTVTPEGTISFNSVSLKLVQDVAWLAKSLGGMSRIHERHNAFGENWVVLLTLPEDRWFYIERKQDRVKPVSQKRYLWRWIDHIEFVDIESVRCISVEAQDGLYVANDMIVTHNTALVAWLVHWFALTNDGVTDWKIPITASAWRQLTKFAMPEVHKWARRLDWSAVGRLPYNERLELTQQSLRLKTGEAFALASDNATMIEGAHASKILYIFDESKEIPIATWDSAEGAFSVGDTYWLSVSTPGEPIGRFYDIQARRPGYDDWHVRHVTREEVIAAGRMSPDWAASRLKQWGVTSAVYQNRVMGEFASSEADGVIPLSWVEKANERWAEWNESDPKPDLPFICLGADIARSGEDKTVLALRFGQVITELRVTTKEDTMQTTGRIKGILDANKGKALVDVIGIGAGVVDRLREMKYEVVPFNASEHTDYMDSANELGFINCRSASWWHMREMLDPSNEHNIALPPDDLLTGDLVSPHWKVTSGGKIQVEGKDDIKERIGRSTDYGDAVVMAFFDNNFLSMRSWTDALKRFTPETKVIRGIRDVTQRRY